MPTEVKVELINRLAATGLPVVECTSFVSAKWVPQVGLLKGGHLCLDAAAAATAALTLSCCVVVLQMGDNAEVMRGVEKVPGVQYPVLTPNMRVRCLRFLPNDVKECPSSRRCVTWSSCCWLLLLLPYPDQQGLESALEAGCEEVAIFGAASDAFSKKNINCTVMDSFERFKPVCEAAKAAGVKVRG